MIHNCLKVIIGLSLIHYGNSQGGESPCPQIFTYETTAETNKWFGNLKIKPEVTLYGFWIDIILDNPAESIGDFADDVSTTDYKEFKVENKRRILNAFSTYNFKFFVKYNPRRSIPKILYIRLNGQQICSASSTSHSRIGSNIGSTRYGGQTTSHVEAISLNRKDSFESTTQQPGRQTSTYPHRNDNDDDNINVHEDESKSTQGSRYSPSIGGNRDTNIYENEPKTTQGSSRYSPNAEGNRDTNIYENEPKTTQTSSRYSPTAGGNRDTNIYENESKNTQSGSRYSPTVGGNINSNTRNTYQPDNQRDRIPVEDSRTQYGNRDNPPNRDPYSINQPNYDRRPLTKDASTQVYETSTKVIYPSQNSQRNFPRVDESNNQENNDNGRRNLRPLNQDNFGYSVDSNRRPQKTTTPKYNRDDSKDYEYSDTERKNNNRDDNNDYFEGDFRISSSSKITPTPLPRNGNNFNSHNENKCGKVAAQPRPLIVGGQSANEGQWPWHAAVYQTQTVDNKYICGGSLVSTSHIVTAAHCVTHRSSSRKVNAQTLTVYLGKYNLRKSTDSVQIMLVRQIYVHPQYNASNYYADLAILKFTKPCDYTMYVRPVCLWKETETDLSNIINQEGTVVGWGFDEDGRVTEELTLVRMPVVKQSTCLWSFKEFYTHFTSEQSYCAGFENGTSVCNGDSGGGMVFSETDYRDNSVTWRLRGLVSIGVAKQYEYKCDPYHYVVFADLAQFLNWIKEKTSDSTL